MKKLAEEVYDFNFGRVMPRCKVFRKTRKLEGYDVDLCGLEGWFYGLSCLSKEDAEKIAEELANDLDILTRVVDAITSEIIAEKK